MDRWMKAGAALCAAGMWMTVQALAQAELASADPAGEAAGTAPAATAPAISAGDVGQD